MGHGAKCDCMICSVGKKMGMISSEQQHSQPGDNEKKKDACPHCGGKRGENGSCACA